MTLPQIMIIDPGLRRPEFDAFNHMTRLSSLPLSYHLPAMFGFESFQAIPTADIRGIVVLGSGASVNDRLPWQIQLESWLRPHLESGIPTLGICYGHQMLAHMFGGKIGWIYPDGSKYLQLRQIRIADELPSHAPQGWRSRQGSAVVSHQEHVALVPPSMRVLATSATVPIDGLIHETLPIFSFQSHPEALPGTARGFGLSLTPSEQDALAFGHALVKTFLEYAANRAAPPRVVAAR